MHKHKVLLNRLENPNAFMAYIRRQEQRKKKVTCWITVTVIMMALAIIMAGYIVTSNFLCPLSHRSKADGIQNSSRGQDQMGSQDETPPVPEPGAWYKLLNRLSSKERNLDLQNLLITGNHTHPDTPTLANTGNTGNSSMGDLKSERPPIIMWD